ncbi:hypothetical protein C0431_12280 [bacterium]|nr:hypothetical protein [bacterium]
MDIIAYGVASKEKRRADELSALLGPGVEGASTDLKGRLDSLIESMDQVTMMANRVIIQNAVNLMKAEARLNIIIQAKRYGLDHMVFDDLLDLSGIDTPKSTGYVHDPILGTVRITNGKLRMKSIPNVPQAVLAIISPNSTVKVSVVVNEDENKKEEIQSEKLHYLSEKIKEGGSNISLMIEGTGTLESISIIWT